MDGDGECATILVPQIPALDFSLAILAKFGPLFAEADFWIPAFALAEDHREPNASPPDDFDAAGLLVRDEVTVVDENEDVEEMPGLAPV